MEWPPGANLPVIARELQRFGFILEPEPIKTRLVLVPPSRAWLAFSLVFALNATLMQTPNWLGGDFALGTLFNLFSLLFSVLALILMCHYIRRQKVYRQALRF